MSDAVGTVSREQLATAHTQTGKLNKWYASSGNIWKQEALDYVSWLRYRTSAT